MTIFEEVRELVDVPSVARNYGVEVHRGNMANCPFHHDSHPSMKLYERNYHCFVCGAHGDAVNLVQKLFRLSAIDAVKQINRDFGLNLKVDKPPDFAEIQHVNRQKQEREAYLKWENNSHNVLKNYLRLMQKYSELYAPKNPDNSLDERFAYSLLHLNYAEFIADEFLFADKETKISMKDEVDKIEREYKKCADKWGK